MPMSLFKSSPERERKKRLKRQKKRAKQYEKRQAKLKRKQEAKASVNNKKTSLNKTLSFIDDVLSIFSPSHARFRHDRLVKQGTMIFMFVSIFLVGCFVCVNSYNNVEYQKAQAANFMTDDLAFSKSDTNVSAGTPFATQDYKTVYIPLQISDMKLIDPDASEYHILVVGKNGQTLKSQITQAQLVSYGSSGLMYLIVKSANQFQSQPVQFLIWSGADITNDEYDPDDNDNDSLSQFKIIAKRYDTLGFTINLGGQSIKAIPKTRTILIKDTVEKKDPKTHKKTKVVETVKRQIPIQANKDLYNNRVTLFLYDHSISKPQVNKTRKSLERKYERMQLALNRINKDTRALTKAGYMLPKFPKWTTNRGNDIAKSLPFSYQQLCSFNMLNPEATFTPKQQKLLSSELRVYSKHKQADGDSSSAEEAYASNLADKVIKNKHIDKTLGNGDGDTDTDSKDNDQAEWTELQNEISELATLKKEMYYQAPLSLWSMYQDFILATSSGNDQNANTGAITYSRVSGHNKHGNFMTIYGTQSKKSSKK